MDGINVEVCGSQGQYLTAILKSIIGDEAVVVYPHVSEAEKRVGLNSVRLGPDSAKEGACSPGASRSFDLKPGLEVEALISGNSHSLGPAGEGQSQTSQAWWPARVISCKGEFVVVALISTASSPSAGKPREEILERDQVRIPSRQPRFTHNTLEKHVIQMPSDLAEFASDPALHVELIRHCGTGLLAYDRPTGQLTVMSPRSDVIRYVSLVEDTHIRMLRQKLALMHSVDQASRRLQSTKLSGRGRFVEEFSIPPTLMGLAIGTHGANIQAARQINGVISVEVNDDDCTFTICAKSEEALQSARAKLEYSEVAIPVPRDSVARIIGKSGSNVQNVVDKSGVVRVKIESPGPGEEEEEETPSKDPVPFIFIGTLESINNARILIEFQLEHIKELEKMQEERLHLVRELNIVERSSNRGGRRGGGPPFYPPPMRGGFRGGIFRGGMAGPRPRDYDSEDYASAPGGPPYRPQRGRPGPLMGPPPRRGRGRRGGSWSEGEETGGGRRRGPPANGGPGYNYDAFESNDDYEARGQGRRGRGRRGMDGPSRNGEGRRRIREEGRHGDREGDHRKGKPAIQEEETSTKVSQDAPKDETSQSGVK